MYRPGHIGLAALFAALPVFILFQSEHYIAGALFLIFAVGSCTLPDRVEDVFRLSHRGVTHTVGFALTTSVILARLAQFALSRDSHSFLPGSVGGVMVGLAVFTGLISHLAGDILTEGYDYRVTPWWPVNKKSYQLQWVKAGNPTWNYSLLAAGIATNTLIVLAALTT